MDRPRLPFTTDELQEFLWSFAGHRVLTVAARAGLLRRVAAHAATSAELAAELGLDELATGKIVRALCALGFVEASGERYRLPEGLQPLFDGGQDDLTAFVEHSHSLYERWGESLEDWLHGKTSEQRQRRSAESLHAFSMAMAQSAHLLAPQVAAAVDLSGVRSVLDVGGGVGAYAREFCRTQAGLHATVLDLPEVVQEGERLVADSPYRDRIEFRGADYLEADFGVGFDLVLLANILHQESAASAATLVQQSARALREGTGRVAIVDFAIDEQQRVSRMGALFAINMRSFGDVYPESTLRRWMHEAGLVDVWRAELSPDKWLIVGRHP